MLATLQQRLLTHATRPLLTVLLAICVLGFWAFNLSHGPVSNLTLRQLSGGDGLLDLRPFYSADTAYVSLQHFGESGRALYLRFLGADLVFLLAYGLGLSMVLSRLLAAQTRDRSPWRLLGLLPLAIAMADLLEDGSIFAMLLAYPQPLPGIGTVAGIMTATKHGLTALTLACLLLALLRWLVLRRVLGRGVASN